MPLIFPGLEVLVFSGDVLSGLTVGEAGAYVAAIIVELGGTVIDTGISTSGYLELEPGALAIGVVNSAGAVLVDGTVLSDTQVASGTASVKDGGVSIGTTLWGSSSLPLPGVIFLGAGSLAIGTMILSGGVEAVDSGGVASGTIVSSGGSEGIWSGGVAIGTTVGAGGLEGIYDGGVASGLTILSGGTLMLSGYGANFTIASDGTLDGDTGASTFTIASGGTLVVGALDQLPNPFPATCTLTGYTVSTGVTFELGVQGGAVSTTVVSGGEVMNWDGVASGTTVGSGGTLFRSNGVASSTTSKYPPAEPSAEPGALGMGPLEAAVGVADAAPVVWAA